VANWELDGKVLPLIVYNDTMPVATWQNLGRAIAVRHQVPNYYHRGSLVSSLLYGMKAHWPLLANGNDVYEFGSGTAHNFTASGATFSGSAAVFDGTNDHLSIAHHADLTPADDALYGGNYAIAFTVIFNDVTRAEECLIYKSSGTNGIRVRHLTTNNTLEFSHISSGTSKTVSINNGQLTFVNGTPYRVVCWFDESDGRAKMRIDDTITVQSTGGGTPINTENATLYVGSEAGSNWLSGQMRHLSFWKLRFLSESELTADYAQAAYPF
jgi:hypothetical protein